MRHHNRRTFHVAAFATAVSLFWAALYVYVPNLAVHARSQGATDTMIGLIVGSYGFTQLLLRIPLGILSDRLGVRKNFILMGFLALAVSSVGLALARSPLHMLLARGLAGVAASSWVASTVLFASFYPPSQAVRSTSIMSFASSSGQMVATLAGGYIAARYGMTAPFCVAAFVAVVGLLVISPAPEERKGSSETPSYRQILAVLTLPTLFSVSLVAATVQYAAFATSYAFIPIYADEVLKLDPAQIGILTSAVLVPYAIMTTVVASLSTRVREERLIAVGLLILATTTAATTLTASFSALLAARVSFGLGMGLTYPVLMGLSIKTVPQAQRASAMGAFQAIYALGMTAGPTLSGFISDQFTLAPVFWITGLMCLLALPLLWLAPTARRTQKARLVQ